MQYIIQERQTHLKLYNVWFDLYTTNDFEVGTNMIKALHKKYKDKIYRIVGVV